jgi:hypothetical protein
MSEARRAVPAQRRRLNKTFALHTFCAQDSGPGVYDRPDFGKAPPKHPGEPDAA